MSDKLRFDGQVAIVTGAGGGLGRAHAQLLASRGARVLVNDAGVSLSGEGRKAGPAQAVADAIVAAGGEAKANTDLVEDGDRIVASALDHFGHVDIVVNNAGILRDRAFHNMSDEDWDLVYRTHLFGAYKVTRAAWPGMRERRHGRIVFTSSAAGVFGNFGQANYAAMKLALVGLCRTLAVEGTARGIKANAISPSASSRMSATMGDPADFEALSPELVSPLVALLCHSSCPANGEFFAVGGGWIGAIREQQSQGVRFKEALTPEAILARWPQVIDPAGAATPADLIEGLGPILEAVPNLAASLTGQKS